MSVCLFCLLVQFLRSVLHMSKIITSKIKTDSQQTLRQTQTRLIAGGEGGSWWWRDQAKKKKDSWTQATVLR